MTGEVSTSEPPLKLNLALTDGRFSDTHNFEKPNDVRALELMDRAAMAVMSEYKDVVLAFGESDEYRCVSAHLLRELRQD